jgi:2',3'-cyclic-nucleotide 2'-phosphodiesterase (5'-nucleotidase family)
MARILKIVFLLLLLPLASGAEKWQRLVILHTNDIHGHLPPEQAWWINPNFPPPIGNAAGVAAVIREERERAERNGWGLLLLEGGDIFQGTPTGEFSKGRAVIEYMNRMGYDAMTVGNHDLDKGPDLLRSLAGAAEFPMLGANMVDSSGRILDYIRPYVILERGGLKIGILGLMIETLYRMQTPENMKGLNILPEIPTARQWLDTLRAKGVDLVVGLHHVGFYRDKVIADSVPGFDVIVGAHSHTGLRQAYECPNNHTIVVQTFGHLSTVGKLELMIDPGTRQIVGYQSELRELFTEEVPPDTAELSKIRRWTDLAEAGYDSVIGLAAVDMVRAGGPKESSLGNLMADAMREAAKSDVAFQNSGGIRDDIMRGEITYRQIYKVDGFSNTIVTMDMTGEQLLTSLEVSVMGGHGIFQVSGLRMVFDPKRPPMERLVSVEVGGKPIDPKARYRVATNSFLAAGGGNYRIFQEAENWEDTGHLVRQAMVDFIHKHSPVDIRTEGRIREGTRKSPEVTP